MEEQGGTRAALDEVESAGTTVHLRPADVAGWAQVEMLVAQCGEIAPLRGIVHAAGMLGDGLLKPAERPTLWHGHGSQRSGKLVFALSHATSLYSPPLSRLWAG